MRLLELNNHGEVSLTKFLTSDIPPYAILSHTWGEDDEEVTFQDLTQGVRKSKAGYAKIRFCEKQAARDGFQYVWIDTCCIDKSSSTELTEALNSMFRWYRNAAQCYVYLSDVSYSPGWELAFRESRWFTRGWTLQELLAPKSVGFFSGEGELLGSKDSLSQEVREITGIPIEALQGKSLSSFSVPARLSWAEKRETKRPEDKAYSLMGIFGIHMVPIYGEGMDEAFERLRCEIDRRNPQQKEQLQVLQDKNRFDADTSMKEQLQVFQDKNRFDADTSIDQDEPGTLFDLIPLNLAAEDIVRTDVSGRIRLDPNDPSKRLLRIGFHMPSIAPWALVKVGRCSSTNDIILGKGWSKLDQCYFDMHPVTQEVLLHDVSKYCNTQLLDENGIQQIRKYPRQCVVLLDRSWTLYIAHAVFLLKPRKPQDPEIFAKEKKSFVNRPVLEEYEGTYEVAINQVYNLNLRSVSSSGYNTRMNSPFQPERDNEIRYTILRRLGGGSQGDVHEVVDMYTGDYLACKIIRFKPTLKLETEKEFKRKVEARVALLSKLSHEHILGYISSQGWPIGHDINIFQEVCEESFDVHIENFKSEAERERMTRIMFRHVSLGLNYIHTFNPPIIHRDINPSNIVYRSGKYLINDFGIADTINNLHTLGGTNSYMPPELWQGGEQTTGIDIYGLGATIVEALTGFPDLAKRPATRQQWHGYLQTHAGNPLVASMLASSPDERPTAHQIISTLFPDSLPSTEWIQPGLSPKIPRPLQRDLVSGRRKRPNVIHTKPAKSKLQERKESRNLGALSQNERRARSAVAPNRAQRRSSRLKSVQRGGEQD